MPLNLCLANFGRAFYFEILPIFLHIKYYGFDCDEYCECNATNADKWIECVNDFFKSQKGNWIEYEQYAKHHKALVFLLGKSGKFLGF